MVGLLRSFVVEWVHRRVVAVLVHSSAEASLHSFVAVQSSEVAVRYSAQDILVGGMLAVGTRAVGILEADTIAGDNLVGGSSATHRLALTQSHTLVVGVAYVYRSCRY